MKLSSVFELKSRARIALLSSVVFFGVAAITAFELLDNNERLLLDMRYRTRDAVKPMEISEKIVTVDWDEPAVNTVGRWPWNWEHHARLVRFLDLYGADQIAIVDDHFSANPVTTLAPEEAAILEQSGAPIAADHQQFLDAAKSSTLFLTPDLFIPSDEGRLEPSDEKSRREFIARNRPAGRSEAIAAAETFAARLTDPGDLLTAVEMKPPILDLTVASTGLGFNRIVHDEDGIVRRTPSAATFDGKVYPALAVAMAAHAFDIPQNEIIVRPGDAIEFPGKSVRIPIDERGMTMINWTGPYKHSFLHFPFLLIGRNLAFMEAKAAAQSFGLGQGVPALAVHLMDVVASTRYIAPEEIEIVAWTTVYAVVAEYLLLSGATFDDYLQKFLEGEDAGGFGREVWDVVTLNHHVASIVASGDTPAYDAVISELDLVDTSIFQENFRQTVHFARAGRIEDVRPLFFFPPVPLIQADGEKTILSPLHLKDKSVFVGLTATGLNALNPTPFEPRYEMHGMQPNLLNTILTGQFIRELPSWTRYLFIAAYALVGIFLALRLSLTGQILTGAGLSAAHIGAAWLLFAYAGIAIPVMAPLAAIISAYALGVAFRFFEERHERRKVRGLFAAMVNPDVLRMMEESPEKVGLSGEKKEATMFSSDVSGFTTISEGVTAQELADILNIYLTPMSNIIMKYGGYVDKYEGDAIKAAYGVPLPDENHAWKGVCAALEQQEELSAIARMLLLKYGVKITARMGVNTGIVSVGNMGSRRKMQYTVMGDEVTLAEELEPINKLYESWIAIGPETERQSHGIVETRRLDTVHLHHRDVAVFEAMGWDRERYLEYWNDRPLPPLFVDGWLKMSPEKALGYLYYYERKNLPETPMRTQMRELFSGLAPIAIEAMTTADILRVIELPGISDPDTLQKRRESFRKRIEFPTPEDPVAWELAQKLKGYLESPPATAPEELKKKYDDLCGKITETMKAFLDELAKRSAEYHAFMADHCAVSDEQRRVKDIFARARAHYLKRDWDAAEKLLREALAGDPSDGPSMKYLERIARLRKNPPPADWDGVWREE